ncbi:MAG: outer membrane beta-barrel protein [Saprospiraceae bacterium]|nr:outer membrane beta-barrel protein [Saprospiraceae bacterium]
MLILRYIANNKTRIACRVEQYNDRDHLFITSDKIFGFSTNLDRQINDKIQLRLEGKILHADDAIFSFSKKDNFSLTTNLTIRI